MSHLPGDLRGLSTKLILSAAVRLPWTPSSLYLPLIGQSVLDPRGTSSTFCEIFFDDVYRPLKPLPPRARIFDVGAHYGMFAIYALRKLGAAQVHSYEPNPYTFKVLDANVALADPSRKRISLHPCAITLAGGTVQMQIKDDNKTSVDSSVVSGSHRAGDATHLIEVRSVPIDKAIGEHCDFLKFDAEGIEYEVLRHPAITPSRVGEIVAEIHAINTQPQRFSELVNTLLARGYSAFDKARQPLSAQDIEQAGREQRAMIIRFA